VDVRDLVAAVQTLRDTVQADELRAKYKALIKRAGTPRITPATSNRRWKG
jgi:hypothetical protein